MKAGPTTGIPIIRSLYLKPLMYLQHCFIAMNSHPKDDDSMPVCFLLHQYTGPLLRYTRRPVVDLLVAVSAASSASTFALMINPIPHGSGIFRGTTSSPWRWPNLLAVQSLCSNSCSFTTGSLGS